ncbi:MAG: hypothetical protein ACI3XM_10360 [Eubacteriales bacterium]
MKPNFSKCIGLCFCVLFFCLFSVFSLGMLIPGASEAVEGAQMPAFMTDGRISDGFGTDFETWFSRRFAFRGKVVDAFSALKETVFKTGNDQVIVGKDSFLFFSETLNDYTRADPMTEEELVCVADSLSRMAAYAEAHGARFLFVCAPNKNTIYPEYMPDRYCAADDTPSDLDRLYAYLDAYTEVDFIDLRPYLLDAKADTLLYHKRDSHWNRAGAHIAFEAAAEKLGLITPDFSLMTRTEIHTHEGDLDRLLYPGTTKYDDDTVYNLDGQYVYTSAFSTAMDMEITTRSAGESGRLLMFRDSFSSAWLGEFAVTFSDCRFERAVPYRLEQLESAQYDVVIVEMVERNLRLLAGSDARIADGETGGE